MDAEYELVEKKSFKRIFARESLIILGFLFIFSTSAFARFDDPNYTNPNTGQAVGKGLTALLNGFLAARSGGQIPYQPSQDNQQNSSNRPVNCVTNYIGSQAYTNCR